MQVHPQIMYASYTKLFLQNLLNACTPRFLDLPPAQRHFKSLFIAYFTDKSSEVSHGTSPALSSDIEIASSESEMGVSNFSANGVALKPRDVRHAREKQQYVCQCV